jgi:hypothetical protein
MLLPAGWVGRRGEGSSHTKEGPHRAQSNRRKGEITNEVVIVSGVRTAIGDLLGGLKDLNSVELGVIALKAAMEKAGVDPLWRWGPSTSMIIEAMYE